MNSSVLIGDTEAQLLRLDRIFALRLRQQACLFRRLLGLIGFSKALVSPAKLVISGCVAWIQLKHLLKFLLCFFPLLHLHVQQTQLVVRFHHRRLQFLRTFQCFHCLLLLAQLK